MPFTPPSLLARNRSLVICLRVMNKFRICHMQRAVRRYYCEQNSVSKAGFAVNDKAWNNRGSHGTVLLLLVFKQSPYNFRYNSASQGFVCDRFSGTTLSEESWMLRTGINGGCRGKTYYHVRGEILRPW